MGGGWQEGPLPPLFMAGLLACAENSTHTVWGHRWGGCADISGQMDRGLQPRVWCVPVETLCPQWAPPSMKEEAKEAPCVTHILLLSPRCSSLRAWHWGVQC